jgi:ribosomal protein S18 acetylase RimI-like enzyme
MIEIRVLTHMTEADLQRVATGYIAGSKYVVSYADGEDTVSFNLVLTELATPYASGPYTFDQDTLDYYARTVQTGWSFGAYDNGTCIGVVIAELQVWNKIVMVREFHVAEAYRRQGIGRQLMDRVLARARQAGMRSVVCETQTTNTGAISAYRRLGFRMEAVDISLYSNEDYPDKEVAVFMKHRL